MRAGHVSAVECGLSLLYLFMVCSNDHELARTSRWRWTFLVSSTRHGLPQALRRSVKT